MIKSDKAILSEIISSLQSKPGLDVAESATLSMLKELEKTYGGMFTLDGVLSDLQKLAETAHKIGQKIVAVDPSNSLISRVKTFGALSGGDKFIGFPMDGDNRGHGGYLGVHRLFSKVAPGSAVRGKDNAFAPSTGQLHSMPDSMPVIQVE